MLHNLHSGRAVAWTTQRGYMAPNDLIMKICFNAE
jgi:hypothetical protein